MSSRKENLYDNSLYRFVVIVLAVAATPLVALETTAFDKEYHHVIARVELIVFGLLVADFMLNLFLVESIKSVPKYLISLEKSLCYKMLSERHQLLSKDDAKC